ncbi:MAG TPA: hypothetical protein PLU63_01835 [Candidatus Woesebacteria bacterium]|nr:hypothetical protein [Candidatus Woesebacteria bacterium]
MSPEDTKRFDHLSAVTESLRPLTSSDIDIPSMRLQLAEAGLNLGISETERYPFAESQFRNLESGRGVGMVAVLGKEKAEALMGWCQQRAEGGPRLKSKGKISEESEGRGLRQLSADLVQIVTNPEPSQADIDKFCLRTNQRVMKGLLWENRGNEEAKRKVHQAFVNIPKAESTFSSVPSGSVTELWNFLISHN